MAKAKVEFVLKGDEELIKILKKMDYKDMQKAYKKALTTSVKPLVNETKKNLKRTNIKNVNTAYIGKNGKKYKSMLQGVMSSVDVRKPNDNYAKIHIMGEFRLKWFEKGTSIRKTYRKGLRGRILPRFFFKQAVGSVGDKCRDSLEMNIRKSIQQIWEK